MTTGFIGLGVMGQPMATNLVKSSLETTVYNRTAEKAERVRSEGAHVAASIADVGRDCDVIITMLAGDDSVDEVIFGSDGLADHAADGTVIVNMSTTSIEFARSTWDRLAERSLAFVDAPVFGSSNEAAAGELWAVVGAAEDDLQKVRPQLDAMCAAVHRMGDPGAGSAMKLSGNLIVAGMIELLGEGLSLGGRAGLDLDQMMAVLGTIDFRSPIYDAKGAAVLAEQFSPGWPLKHAVKDVGLAQREGQRLGLPMQALAGILASYQDALDAGHGDDDAVAVIKAIDDERFRT